MGSASMQGPLWGLRARDWAEIQEGTARPLYEDAHRRAGVTSGTAYLDVGCGSGMAAGLAAERGAHVSGIDASPALLAIARERVPDADLREGDLESLPFGDGSFDVITGFNSFQYAANCGVALAEARRVGRPGARVIIATWAPPERVQLAVVLAAVKPFLPPALPGPDGPFALSDEAALRALAEAAGLTPLEVVDVDCPFIYPDLETAVRGLNSAGPAARAIQHSGDAAVSQAHREAFSPFRKPDGSVRVECTFRYLLAKV